MDIGMINTVAITSPARRTIPARRTNLARLTNPTNCRRANIALLNLPNDNSVNTLLDLSDITENREILDRLDWIKYLWQVPFLKRGVIWRVTY